MQILLKAVYIIAFCCTFLQVYGQTEPKKSKRQLAYDEFYRQEAIREAYEKQMEVANQAFRNKMYSDAVEAYSKAIIIKSGDQVAISRVKDIEIILSKKDFDNFFSTAAEAMEVVEYQLIEEEAPKPKEELREEVKAQAVPVSKAPGTIAITNEERKIENKPATIVLPEPVASKEVPAEAKKTENVVKMPPKTNTENPAIITKQVDKSSAAFRRALAEKYANEYTEEEFMEGSRKIVRRIIRQDNLADEYLWVTHAWGGVYYFKNGESISYATWVAETDKFFPKK
jgi:hypothetical protein